MTCIAIYDGNVIIGGSYRTYQDVSQSSIRRIERFCEKHVTLKSANAKTVKWWKW